MIRPRFGERRKHRRARADDDLHFAASNAVPLIGPLADGKAAVLNRHTVAERVAKRRRHSRRQRDFRNQHQHRSARSTHDLRKAKVNLCLARAGHTLQDKHGEIVPQGCVAERGQRRRLVGGEHRSCSPLSIGGRRCDNANGSRSTRSRRNAISPFSASRRSTSPEIPRSSSTETGSPDGAPFRQSTASLCRLPSVADPPGPVTESSCPCVVSVTTRNVFCGASGAGLPPGRLRLRRRNSPQPREPDRRPPAAGTDPHPGWQSTSLIRRFIAVAAPRPGQQRCR